MDNDCQKETHSDTAEGNHSKWPKTSEQVKGLKGQKGSFEATIVLKEDFTTSFEFSEKKKTNYKKRTRRIQNNGGVYLCEIQHTNNKKSKIKKQKFVQNKEIYMP